MLNALQEEICAQTGDICRSFLFLSRIGSGGGGEVYEAIDQRLGRHVAVKVVRAAPGLSEIELKKISREARILSNIEHRNICRLYEYFQEGECHYLVLELLDGWSLRTELSLRQSWSTRLRIAEEIVSALTFAHDRGIAHRDLKPENIFLVRPTGEVRLLDFGLARAIRAEGPSTFKLSSRERKTRRQQGLTSLQGTPGYVSPEQLKGARGDRKSDLYSLGVLLQELLTQTSPFPASLNAEELIEHTISGGSIVATVGFDGRKPDRELVDLLERLKSADPAIRPVASDCLRVIKVLRAKPAVRRRQALIRLSACTLLVFSVTFAGLLWRASQEKRRAEQAAESARATSQFLMDLFELGRPGGEITEAEDLSRLLSRAAGALSEDSKLQPETRAELSGNLGWIYFRRGEYDTAEQLLLNAKAFWEERGSAGRSELAQIYGFLGELAREEARYEDSLKYFEECSAMLRSVAIADSAVRAECLENRGVVLHELNRFEEASTHYQESLAIRRSLFGPVHSTVAGVLGNIGALHHSQGEYRLAEETYRTALEMKRLTLLPNDPSTASTISNLGALLFNQGRLREAEALYREAYALNIEELPIDHPRVLARLSNLGDLLRQRGLFGEAESLLRLCVEQLSAGGHQTPMSPFCKNNLAKTLRDIGVYEEAEGLFMAARDEFVEDLGTTRHRYIGGVLHNLGELYRRIGDLDAASGMLAEALAIRRATLSSEHPEIGSSLLAIAMLESSRGDFGRANELAAQAVGVLGGRLPNTHWELQYAQGVAEGLKAVLRGESLSEEFYSLLRALRETIGRESGPVKDLEFFASRADMQR